MPFGDTLKFTGYIDQNYRGIYWNPDEAAKAALDHQDYKGSNWNRYEAALGIEVYDNCFILPGVRYETVDYDYNPTKEAFLFIKGDVNLHAGKFDFGIQPYFYIRGMWFDDYTIKYHINDRAAIILNANSLFDRVIRVKAGVEWKF